MNDIELLFLLDSEVIFLNHGSFGATPRPVFEVYQSSQRRLESQPVIGPTHLATALPSSSKVVVDRDDMPVATLLGRLR